MEAVVDLKAEIKRLKQEVNQWVMVSLNYEERLSVLKGNRGLLPYPDEKWNIVRTKGGSAGSTPS